MTLGDERPSGAGSSAATVATRAARGGAAFTIVTVAQRAVPFLLLPVFASVLRPGEYGQIAVLVSTGAVLGALLGVGLEPATLRTYVQLAGDPVAQRRFVSTIGVFAAITPLIGAVLAVVTLGPLLAAQVDGTLVILLAFIGIAAQTTTTVLVGAVLRAQERLYAYAFVSLTQTVGSAAVALLLVVGARTGVPGWFAGQAFGATLALGVGITAIARLWTPHLSWPYLREALRYGLPLLPHSLSHWTLSLSDRVILASFIATSSVGVYNLAYQLASPIGVILIAARQGMMPMYAAADSNASIRGELSRLATIQSHLAALLGLAVALVGPSIVPLLFPPTYDEAAVFLPLIALGFVFFGLYLIPVDAMSLMLGRTTWLWLPTGVAAMVNVVLNFVLVPRYGATAAAFSTAVAYAVLLVGVMVLRHRTEGPRIRYDLRRMAIGLAAVVGTYSLAIAVAPDHAAPLTLWIRIGAVAAIGAALLRWDRSWWTSVRTGSPA